MQKKTNFLKLAEFRKTSYLYDSLRKVKDKDLQLILEAGRLSPSCHNSQPWKFIVVKSPDLIAKLIPTIVHGRPPRSPSVIIAIVFTPQLTENAPNCTVTDISGVSEGFMSIGMAALQMSLQATELGLATAFLSPKEELVRPILAISQSDRIPFLFMLGYEPKNAPKRPKIRRELKAIVEYREL